MTEDYGDLTIERDGDSVRVTRADPTIAITAEPLADADPRWITTDAAGALVICGTYRYSPIRFAEHGRVVICYRWEDSGP